MNTLKSLVSAAILFSVACSEAPKSEPQVAPPVGVATPATEAPTASSDAAATPGALVITPFGVPDCDNYIKKYMACVDGKVTEGQKAALMEQFAANQTKWRALSTMREGAVALSLACRAANQKAKEELAVEYGCEF